MTDQEWNITPCRDVQGTKEKVNSYGRCRESFEQVVEGEP